MNLALLMLLALLWAVVLLPSAIRSRRRSLHHSMGGFARAMTVLSGGQPSRPDLRRVLVPGDAARIVAPPRGADLARERRRRALGMLSTVAGLSLTLAVLAGGTWWLLTVVTTGALATYVVALRQIAVSERARRELVPLDSRRERRVPEHYEQHRAVVG